MYCVAICQSRGNPAPQSGVAESGYHGLAWWAYYVVFGLMPRKFSLELMVYAWGIVVCRPKILQLNRAQLF